MRRREFVIGVAAAAAWPISALAQEPGRIYRVAVLLPLKQPSPSMDAFLDEMRQAGFVQGHNLDLDAPDGVNLSDEQIARLTEKLVNARPDAIVAGTAAGTRAAQRATRTIPIVASCAANAMISPRWPMVRV
jgi:putative ABC transport system substrate-binding protein